ncbi:MAG: DUF4442 domain-containing protein [Saprospiraceae bacterium]|nr:DUF4442 domain-containing protein [Saprospiraceae bacterium]
MPSAPASYRKKITNPFIYFFFMLWRLPSLIFWGVKVRYLSDAVAIVTIKHKWTNQNPFGSVYFSALNGAAELSTGIMVQSFLQGLGPYSMLVVESNATFVKKAKGRITFTCEEGSRVNGIIYEMEKSGIAQSFWLTSTGTDEAGDVIGKFSFLWSLKKK